MLLPEPSSCIVWTKPTKNWLKGNIVLCAVDVSQYKKQPQLRIFSVSQTEPNMSGG